MRPLTSQNMQYADTAPSGPEALFNKLGGREVLIQGMTGPAPCWLAARFARIKAAPVLWIAPDARQARRAVSDLQFFLPGRVLHFPGHDTLPFLPVAPSPRTAAQRLSTLHSLAEASAPFICVTDILTLLEPVIPRPWLEELMEYVVAGEEIDRDSLLEWFVTAGYEHVPMVQAPGEFCVRGGVVDFSPPGVPHAVRLDMFGDTVEEIRLFDPLNQRSTGSLEELVILPATELPWHEDLVERARQKAVTLADRHEWPARKLHSLLNRLSEKQVTEAHRALYPLFFQAPSFLFDYLPGNTRVIFPNPGEISRNLDEFRHKAVAAYSEARASRMVLCELEELICPAETVLGQIGKFPRWYFSNLRLPDSDACAGLPGAAGTGESETVEIACSPPELPPPPSRLSRGEAILAPALENIARLRDQGQTVCIACSGRRNTARMLEIIDQYLPELPVAMLNARSSGQEVSGEPGAGMESDPGQPGIFLANGRLSAGFALPDLSLVLITEEEVLGTAVRRARPSKRRRATDPVTFEDLAKGQPVVHLDHGIGLYQGMVRLNTGGAENEFLVLEYQKGDKLYLPVDRLSLIQRYTGVEGRQPRIDRLGGSSWRARQLKVRKSISQIAHDLVELYAARRVREGIEFSPPGEMFRQFEAEFPFEETRDQAAAIDDILADMQRPHPMDRLLCGDVGYGKTEVAMRAAFKAVEDSMQVAVLVPTTLLAEQHERTFRRRFRRFPVEIAALSRIKSRREQQETLERTRRGEVDILIGTHRLLQSDVQFKNIGLLIVDEEHRFGVKHKEKLKNLRQNLDSLALTATPIPRTLQLSMLGIRDISTINTPPAERLPVKTFLAEFDSSVIKTAIENEKARGGQVFFVHNRVKGIHAVADTLRRLCPDVRVEVAHGQMGPAELEMVMIDFVRGETDCLVCTTIIESGIDIPAANTMIVNRADTLGLADMYQLRGRVGRGSEQAYAYLLVNSLETMTPKASSRLRAIMEFSSAGGGFRLAMQDLQIRGAGNILGVSQSGQIADVGYDMYLDLLQRAVEELKGTPVRDETDPEVNLGIPAFIPDDYVPDPGQRLELYRRLSRARGDVERLEIEDELADRFGPLPPEVMNLRAVLEIKELLRRLNATRLDLGRKGGVQRMVVAFHQDGPPGAENIVREAATRKKWSLLPDSRLTLEIPAWENSEQLTGNIKRGLQTVLEAAKTNL